jgi:hypothetical protein
VICIAIIYLLFVCANRILGPTFLTTHTLVTSRTSLLFKSVSNLFIKDHDLRNSISCGPYRLLRHNIRATWQKFTSVSETLIASVFRVENDAEDSRNMLLRNGGKFLPDYTASNPTRNTIIFTVTAVITFHLAPPPFFYTFEIFYLLSFRRPGYYFKYQLFISCKIRVPSPC